MISLDTLLQRLRARRLLSDLTADGAEANSHVRVHLHSHLAGGAKSWPADWCWAQRRGGRLSGTGQHDTDHPI